MSTVSYNWRRVDIVAIKSTSQQGEKSLTPIRHACISESEYSLVKSKYRKVEISIYRLRHAPAVEEVLEKRERRKMFATY